MERENKINKEMHIINNLINKASYQIALRHLRRLGAENLRDNIIKINKAGFLIDIGYGLKNHEIVKKGVTLLEELLKGPFLKEPKANLYYNCANGYMSLYHLEYNKEMDIKQVVDNENLQKAKYSFREAIREPSHSNQSTKN
jgi:hypothetical protein